MATETLNPHISSRIRLSFNVLTRQVFCLLVATVLAIVLGRSERQKRQQRPDSIIGGSIWEGAVHVFKSKYMLLICLLMLSHNLTSTFLYNGLAVLVDQNIVGFNERIAMKAVSPVTDFSYDFHDLDLCYVRE